MFWTVWLIHIEYRLNMITIQIQCKSNLLCSKLYYNHTWIALILATALTLSTSEKILRTKSFTSEKAQRFCTPNLFGCSKCSPRHHVILSELAWHTRTSLASYYNVMLRWTLTASKKIRRTATYQHWLRLLLPEPWLQVPFQPPHLPWYPWQQWLPPWVISALLWSRSLLKHSNPRPILH